MQYRYTILFKPTMQKYHGSKYGKDADPNTFWVDYFTSSTVIKNLIDQYGVDSFEVLEIILHPNDDAYLAETEFLVRNNCKDSELWLNRSNNDYTMGHSSDLFKDRMIAKYGVEHNMKSEYLMKSRSDKHEEKYGDGIRNPFQRQEVKDKTKAKLIELYGVDNCMKSDIVKSKVKTTCMERYGVENVFASTDIIQKINDTFYKKYGCHPRQLKEVEDKKKDTCLQKYGVDSYSKTDEFKSNIRKKVWYDLSDSEKESIREKSSIARKNDPIIQCDYCCLTVKNKGLFNRFHGDNCKLNPLNIHNIIGSSITVYCEHCGWHPKLSGERSNLLRHIEKCKYSVSTNQQNKA